jgi:hypothetical protein
MKKLLILGVLFGFGFTFASLDDSLRLLKLPREEALNLIRLSLVNANLNTSKAIGKVIATKRVQITEDMLRFAWDYTNTPQFDLWWKEYREAQKPMMQPMPSVSHDMRGDHIRNLEAKLAETRAEQDTASESQKARLNGDIIRLEKTLKELQAMSPKQDSMMNQMFTNMRDEALNDYNHQIEFWKQRYPENGKLFVKARLDEYLALAASVDFSAQLKPGPNGVLVFVEDEYENKNYQWKLCYRAGREANNAAIKIVREWLRELNK